MLKTSTSASSPHLPLISRAIAQTNKSLVSCPPGPGVLENWGGWGALLISLSFGDLLTLVKFNAVKKKKKSQLFLRIFLCVPPPLFYHSGPFPHAVTERSVQLYWYTSLAQFHEREIIYQWKETSLLFSDYNPTPHPTEDFLFYHRKRKWMSANLCVFEVGRMKASSSAWAQQQVGWGVGVCLYLSGKSTPRTQCAWARVYTYLLI